MNSRHTDPQTSHIAGEHIEAKGTAASHRALCLEAVRKHPGSTCAEIAMYAGLDRHQAGKRLPELRDKYHKIENGPNRICVIQGSLQMTWVLAFELRG